MLWLHFRANRLRRRGSTVHLKLLRKASDFVELPVPTKSQSRKASLKRDSCVWWPSITPCTGGGLGSWKYSEWRGFVSFCADLWTTALDAGIGGWGIGRVRRARPGSEVIRGNVSTFERAAVAAASHWRGWLTAFAILWRLHLMLNYLSRDLWDPRRRAARTDFPAWDRA